MYWQASVGESSLPQPDFQLLFESAPGAYLVLTPVLLIVAVSDAYLWASMTKLDEILERYLLDAISDRRSDHMATDIPNICVSGSPSTRMTKQRRSAHGQPRSSERRDTHG